MSSGNGQPVFTYGWDTVFSIPVPYVNQAIVDHGSSPPSFSYSDDDLAASADFGDWQIVQGGDGQAVYLSLPMTNLSLTIKATGKTLPFPSGTATIEVQLQYLPASAGNGGSGTSLTTANLQQLVVNAAMTPAVVLVTTDIPGADDITASLFSTCLTNWGNANLAQFAHVFAVVDLNQDVDQGNWGFVAPNDLGYAYLDGATLETSVLAVLCTTGSRNSANLPLQVSPSAIPGTSVAGFLISQTRVMDDLVRTAISQAYQINPQTLILSPDGMTLTLPQGTTVPLPPITYKGSPYNPQLVGLTVQAVGSTITLTSVTTTYIELGITSSCTATHWYEIALGTSNNGQTLQFQESQPSSIVHTIDQSGGVKITELIIEIVGAVLYVVLAVVTDGAALIVGGLVIGLLMGATQIIPTLIEQANTNASPSIDLLLANAVSPITWTDSSSFSLDYAGLNVSLQLGGNPGFTYTLRGQ